jgi:two-component system, NarL family, sensor histidine kinase DevS
MTKPPPSVLLAFLFTIILAIFAIGATLALRLPNLGIDVDVGPKGQLLIVSITNPAKPIPLPATLIAIAEAKNPTKRIVLENDHHLIAETQLAPKISSLRDQDVLFAIAQKGPVILELRDARGQFTAIERTAAGHNALTSRFWMLSLAGLTCALISAWVFVLRPSFFAAQVVFLSGVSLFTVSLPLAATFAGDFIVGGTIWLWAQAINMVAGITFGAAVFALFCYYPQKLLSVRQCLIAMALIIGPTIMLAFLWPDAIAMLNFINILVPLNLLCTTIAFVFQWRATRKDPVGRAFIRLVGATFLIFVVVWIAFSVMRVVLKERAPIEFAASMWLLVPPFFAMAYGVGKGFMFEASTWAGKLLLSAATLLALLGADLALIFAVGLDEGTAASGAFFIVGAVWFLARNALVTRFLGTSSLTQTSLFDQAVHVALARDDTERASRWQAALQSVFQPLDMQLSQQSAGVGVMSGGLSLGIPPVRFAPAMLLTNKRAGTQVFTGADVKLVETLKAMCERIDTDRDAYERGAQAERGRIARDLHDDVSSRLLTSLHRHLPERMQGDVREALSDIRSIISGLDGDRQQIDDVLSAIRIEVLDRLEAAGIDTHWPLDGDKPVELAEVEYRVYRNLNAIMREITSNIIRHANATRVEILAELIVGDAKPFCRIEVFDNGIGLAADKRKGNGLVNIAARVTEIEGSVTFVDPISTTHQSGTRIALKIPLPPYMRGPHVLESAVL